MERVRIRPAVVHDIVAIQSVARQSWADAYAGIIPGPIQEQALSAWYSDESLRKSIEAGRSLFFVAEADDEVIAFAQFAIHSTHAELARIYVLPGQQRHGTGSGLLKRGMALITTRITVTTEEENIRGRRFYERNGFRLVEQKVSDLFGHELKLVTYERSV